MAHRGAGPDDRPVAHRVGDAVVFVRRQPICALLRGRSGDRGRRGAVGVGPVAVFVLDSREHRRGRESRRSRSDVEQPVRVDGGAGGRGLPTGETQRKHRGVGPCGHGSRFALRCGVHRQPWAVRPTSRVPGAPTGHQRRRHPREQHHGPRARQHRGRNARSHARRCGGRRGARVLGF